MGCASWGRDKENLPSCELVANLSGSFSGVGALCRKRLSPCDARPHAKLTNFPLSSHGGNCPAESAAILSLNRLIAPNVAVLRGGHSAHVGINKCSCQNPLLNIFEMRSVASL
eukprot:313524-Pyramimonas_sp.AAC.1